MKHKRFFTAAANSRKMQDAFGKKDCSSFFSFLFPTSCFRIVKTFSSFFLDSCALKLKLHLYFLFHLGCVSKSIACILNY